MFAPQNQQPTVLDALTGSMEEWYESIDSSIRKSDVIPGNYEYTVAPSYGNVGPINEGSSTHVDITCDRFKVISLENSYISIDQEIEIEVPAQTNLKYTTYYIGYKFAGDAISQYRLYTNSDHLLTQNHAHYEWFMIYNSVSDQAKENSDLYATLHKIRNKSPYVPGTYVDLKAIDKATKIKVPITVRIPVSSFLTLYNLRYFPNWSGRLTIEFYPSYKNIVVAPVIPEQDIPLIEAGDVLTARTQVKINLGFYNINQTMWNKVKDDGNITINLTGISGSPSATLSKPISTKISLADATPTNNCQVFKCNGNNCLAKNCKIRLATYLLKMDLFNALAAKYIQVPLIFPIQLVQIKDFTNPVPGSDGPFTTANTLALKHCDAMFTVFKSDQNATTCFVNPFLDNIRFNVDGKFYPREDMNTYNDVRFVNTTFDALNINNSLMTCISKDLQTSLQPFHNFVEYATAGSAGGAASATTSKRKWTDGDQSNFIVGIPFCDSDDFMGGISTVGAVQIELSGNRARDTDELYKLVYPATTICFEDAFLKIRAMKPDGRPQIEITNATIEQISLGAV